MSKPKILIVEDDVGHAALTYRYIKEAISGVEVIQARDGQEALDVCLNENRLVPRFIILDINLPKVSGHEVLHSLKSNESTKNIPVVVLTTSDNDIDRLQAYEYGANSYVQKPAETGSYSTTISSIVNYWHFLNRSY